MNWVIGREYSKNLPNTLPFDSILLRIVNCRPTSLKYWLTSATRFMEKMPLSPKVHKETIEQEAW